MLVLGALFKAVGLLRTLPATTTGTKNVRRACLAIGCSPRRPHVRRLSLLAAAVQRLMSRHRRPYVLLTVSHALEDVKRSQHPDLQTPDSRGMTTLLQRSSRITARNTCEHK